MDFSRIFQDFFRIFPGFSNLFSFFFSPKNLFFFFFSGEEDFFSRKKKKKKDLSRPVFLVFSDKAQQLRFILMPSSSFFAKHVKRKMGTFLLIPHHILSIY